MRVEPTSEFEATVGPPALRRSCGIAAVVGLLSYYDDQSLVIVMEATPRHGVCDRGPMPVHAIAKTAFLPLKPPPGTGTRSNVPLPRSRPCGHPRPPEVRTALLRAAIPARPRGESDLAAWRPESGCSMARRAGACASSPISPISPP